MARVAVIPDLSRADRSPLGQWWWTVDRWLLAALALLIFVGVFLVQAASPAVAARIGTDNLHFVLRHGLLLLPALAVMFFTSLLSPLQVRKLAVALCVLFGVLTFITLFAGVEIKGARRWLMLGGFSLQPSEFLKPCFAVTAAWLMSRADKSWIGNAHAAGLFVLLAGLLVAQPDLGMTIVLTAVWGAQFFLHGMPILLIVSLPLLALGLGVAAYVVFPHAQARIDAFLSPGGEGSFQVQRSLEAFMNGGLLGTGPGEGTVKMSIPDAHTDFIFAVMGEELGLIWCLALVAVYAFIVVRGLRGLQQESRLFVLLAVTGLLVQFGLQAFINLGSTLHLLPTKGMTLPFVSYGGSSLWALSLGMGMILALTRKRFGPQEDR